MIHLVRHGETEFNRADRVQGRVDTPLTRLGEAQARAIGERLAHLRETEGGDWTLETSPLGRARQTAEIIAGVAGLPEARVEPALIEVDYGAIEGLTPAELEAAWPGLARGGALFGRAPGGESLAELMARASAWLAARAGGPAVVAVTHAGFARAARGAYLGLSENEIRALDKPQDAIFRLAGGREERLDCPPLPPPAGRG